MDVEEEEDQEEEKPVIEEQMVPSHIQIDTNVACVIREQMQQAVGEGDDEDEMILDIPQIEEDSD